MEQAGMAKAGGRSRGWRWAALAVLAAAAIALVAVAAGLWLPPQLATWIAARQLRAFGQGSVHLPVLALTPRAALIGPVTVGEPGNELTIDRIVIGYHEGELLDRRIDSVRIYGVTAILEQRGGRWRLHGLDQLLAQAGSAEAGSTGGKGGFTIRTVRVTSGLLIVRLNERDVRVPFSATVHGVGTPVYHLELQAAPSGNACTAVVEVAMTPLRASGSVVLDGWALDRWRPLTALPGAAEPLLAWGSGQLDGTIAFSLDRHLRGEVDAALTLTHAHAQLDASHPLIAPTLAALPEPWSAQVDSLGCFADRLDLSLSLRSPAVAAQWTADRLAGSLRDWQGDEIGRLDLTRGGGSLRGSIGPDGRLEQALAGELALDALRLTGRLPGGGAAVAVLGQVSASHDESGGRLAVQRLTVTHPRGSLEAKAGATWRQPPVPAPRDMSLEVELTRFEVDSLASGAGGRAILRASRLPDGGWMGGGQVRLSRLTTRAGGLESQWQDLTASPEFEGSPASFRGRLAFELGGGTVSGSKPALIVQAGAVRGSLDGEVAAGKLASLKAVLEEGSATIEAPNLRTEVAGLAGSVAMAGAWTAQTSALSCEVRGLRAYGVQAETIPIRLEGAGQMLTLTADPVALAWTEQEVTARLGLTARVELGEDWKPARGSLEARIVRLQRGTTSLDPFRLAVDVEPTRGRLEIVGPVRSPQWPEVAVSRVGATLSKRGSPAGWQLEAMVDAAADTAAVTKRWPKLTFGAPGAGFQARAAVEVPPFAGDPLAMLEQVQGTAELTVDPVAVTVKRGDEQATATPVARLGVAFSPREIDLTGSVELSGVTGEAKGIRLEGGGVSVRLDECRLPLAAGYRPASFELLRHQPWLRRHLACRGELTATAGAVLQARDGLLKGVRLGLPWQWTGGEGFGATAGRLEIETLAYRGVRLAPVAWPIELAAEQLRMAGSLAIPGQSLTIAHETTANLAATGWSAACAYRIAVPNLAEATPLLQQAGGVELQNVQVDGAIGLVGVASFDAGGLGGEAAVTLSGVRVKQTAMGLTLTGIDGIVNVSRYWPVQTRAHQRLTFGPADVAGLPVAGGTVDFRVESPEAIFLERCELSWCGGKLSAHAVQFNPVNLDFDLVLWAEKIEVGQLFALQKGLQGKATGELYGKLPLGFHRGRIFYRDGFLYTPPNRTGNLQVTNADALLGNALQSDPRLAEVSRSLKNLDYQFLRVDLEGGGGEESRLRLQVHGRQANSPNSPPIHLNTTVSGRLQELINAGLYLKQKGVEW